MTSIIIYSKKQQQNNCFFKPKINQKNDSNCKVFYHTFSATLNGDIYLMP